MVLQPMGAIHPRDFGPKRLGRRVLRHLSYSDEERETKKTPFIFGLVNMCMDSQGNILHMPMGDYRTQNSFELGRVELMLMKLTKRISHIHPKSLAKRTTKEMKLIRRLG